MKTKVIVIVAAVVIAYIVIAYIVIMNSGEIGPGIVTCEDVGGICLDECGEGYVNDITHGCFEEQETDDWKKCCIPEELLE